MTIDKRVSRTKSALRIALLELMVEHGYERLSVQQILDRAAVGRATFYLHYRSKEDLLRGSFDQLREGLAQHCAAAAGDKKRAAAPLGFSLAFFQHVDGHRKLYRAVVGRASGVIVDQQMRRLLADLVRAEFDGRYRRSLDATRIELVAHSIAGALISVVSWWLDFNIKLTPEEVNALFRQMAVPGLEAIRTGS